jgi:hypothetical protein
MTAEVLSQSCPIHGMQNQGVASLPPLSQEEMAIASQIDKVRNHLVSWHTADRKNRVSNFNQEKALVFQNAKELLAALHHPLPATEEIDYQAVIDGLKESETIARSLEGKIPNELTICLMNAETKSPKLPEFGFNLGPMILDLQFSHEAAMHEKMHADTQAIEKDTANLETIRKTLAQLHAYHKKDEGVNFEKQDPETFKKVKELLDAVYAIDSNLWKKGAYTFDENDYQGIVENLNGKTQAIARLINSKHLTIEQTMQLRNLLNNAIADIERKRQRESDKMVDNQPKKGG